MRVKHQVFGVRCLVLGVWCILGGCNNQPALHKESRVIMGTFAGVISPDERAAGIAFAEIRRIEKLLSKYDPDSEVSKLNSSGELKASPETYYIIKKSKAFSAESAGAFDITVAPLVELWGFKEKNFRVPAKEEIASTLERVGSDKIILNDADNSVKFSVSGMSIDLGAVAKGYAVDCAARKLKESGISSAIVNVGGEVYALGLKSGKPWVVAIRSPDKKSFHGKLELIDRAASTSGNYEQFFIKDNIRYSHIFDPKTGMPVDSGIRGITVLADDCLTADSLATAIFVLGPEKGIALAEKISGAEVARVIKEKKRGR
ncbi:MAG: FAD:protein FMN transferase [Candidatus Omnitrophota bacterium]